MRTADMALLLGATLLFVLLAAIIIATRGIDWYRIAAERPARLPGGQGSLAPRA